MTQNDILKCLSDLVKPYPEEIQIALNNCRTAEEARSIYLKYSDTLSSEDNKKLLKQLKGMDLIKNAIKNN